MSREQILVQLTDRLVAALDERAARSGVSRSELIRAAIESHLGGDLDAALDAAIVEGYRRVPPVDDPWVAAAAAESIAAEPW